MRVGLPRMHQEAAERRDFLPDLVGFLETAGATEVVLEEGYGSGMGVAPGAYEAGSGISRFGTYEECLAQDLVVVIRCPADEVLEALGPGTFLVTMLHMPTRPERARAVHERGTRGLSLDSVVDDVGNRLVENLGSVGWNGVEAAFKQLARLHPNFAHPSRRPLHVTCLGAGGVAGHAVRAATRYGDSRLREELVSRQVPGVEVTVVDFDLTWHEDYMLGRLERTDLLIDATHRTDQSRPVIPNAWVAALPRDAVLLDLSADPYDLDAVPPVTKGIEGVPQGDLDRYVFAPDDPAYEVMDARIDTAHRRTALSCSAWPGLHPVDCMRRYGTQIRPLLALLLAKPVDAWDPEGGSFEERAAARGELSRWLKAQDR